MKTLKVMLLFVTMMISLFSCSKNDEAKSIIYQLPVLDAASKEQELRQEIEEKLRAEYDEKLKETLDSYTKSHVFFERCGLPVPKKYEKNISSYSGFREGDKIDTGGIPIGNMHYGIDYAIPDKTPVYAAKDGYVTCVYPGPGNGTKWKGEKTFGALIVIKHYDGTSTLYGHLYRTDVAQGYYVSKGQQIALSGGVKGRRGSGASSGPHLHFAIYPDIIDQFDITL